MPTSQFVPHATAAGANARTAAQWIAAAVRQAGFQAGVASSADVNTALRQSTSVAAMIGSFIVLRAGLDANDDGNITALESAFEAAVRAVARSAISLDAPPASIIHAGTAGGSANAYTVATLTPAVTSLATGTTLILDFSTPNTGASTITFNNLTSPVTRDIVRADGSALKQSDIIAGSFAFSIRPDGKVGLLNYNPSSAPARTLVSQTTPGTYTFTVPAGVYWIYGTAVGAGGGASGGAVSGGTNSGGGGGAGGTAEGWIAVTPGQVITYVVGTPGAGAAYQQTGDTGGTSSIGAYMQATGGDGGGGAPPAGGAGGIGTGGQKNLYGGNGGDGSPSSGLAPGGNGGASSLGGGGRTSSFYLTAVSNGRAPGSGGGGTYSNGSGVAGQSGGVGGTGAPGYVAFLL